MNRNMTITVPRTRAVIMTLIAIIKTVTVVEHNPQYMTMINKNRMMNIIILVITMTKMILLVSLCLVSCLSLSSCLVSHPELTIYSKNSLTL